MPRLKDIYLEKVVPLFMAEGAVNRMAVPKVEKVVLNVGVGKIRGNQQMMDLIAKNLTAISGQKPAIRRARKAISGFKVREGDEVGYTVTLRGDKMYDFLDKLINVTLPRIRDFRGLKNESFDNNGNYTLGFREHIYFPETAHQSDNIHGLELTVVTSASTKEEAQKLLKGLGFPFKEQQNG